MTEIQLSRKGKNTSSFEAENIALSHGGGGKHMHDLIDKLILPAFTCPELSPLEDQARIPLAVLSAQGDRLAFSTDSFVVDPLFFPGGDIGKLAVNGTINDLAVGGARPLYLSCGFIIEEGLPTSILARVLESMRMAALEGGVSIVTGDTKVVNRGAADKLFVNTSGVGVIQAQVDLAANNARSGDVVIVNGTIGDHGAAIVSARGDLAIENDILSDCCSLYGLISELLANVKGIRTMRDATRGGIASVLNEIASASRVGIFLDESSIPVLPAVRGVCEILGFDPLYLANEGKLVLIAAAEDEEEILSIMHNHQYGQAASKIGVVKAEPQSMVVLRTAFGGQRIVDMLSGDQLPRIC